MYFKPSYRPHNGAANILVKSLSEELGLSLSKKYEIVLASFLAVAKKVNGQTFDWWTGKNEKLAAPQWQPGLHLFHCRY